MKIIEPQDWFRLPNPPPLLDVRSPGEFAAGHWPGAESLPLFDNDERAEVGTLYKQQSPDAAFLRGLELAGQKMRWYVEEARRLAPDGTVAIHCWRGGQRSQSMGWLLEKSFPEVQLITGGYKALRREGRVYMDQFTRPLLILGGVTGSGKTKVLHALQKAGEEVIDLEGLAVHKGSAFGGLGLKGQPTVEQFENELFNSLLHIDAVQSQSIWLEDESKSIGKVYIPKELWEKMQGAALVMLDLPLEWRLENLIKDYADQPVADLQHAFERIRKRLGGQHVKAAVEALEQQDFEQAAIIALRYYDKAYNWGLQKHGRQIAHTLRPSENNPELIAQELLEWRKSQLS